MTASSRPSRPNPTTVERPCLGQKAGRRPLIWAVDGAAYSALELAKTIVERAGAQFPGAPSGPHWWRRKPG